MQISITDSDTLAFVQKEFSALFPYLKLEFFFSPELTGMKPVLKPVRDTNQTLASFRSSRKKSKLILTPEMSSASLEELFKETFGITLRLYRKSGKEWLTITSSDKWSLEQQNNEGKALAGLR